MIRFPGTGYSHLAEDRFNAPLFMVSQQGTGAHKLYLASTGKPPCFSFLDPAWHRFPGSADVRHRRPDERWPSVMSWFVDPLAWFQDRGGELGHAYRVVTPAAWLWPPQSSLPDPVRQQRLE
jgi:hypothetical protein